MNLYIGLGSVLSLAGNSASSAMAQQLAAYIFQQGEFVEYCSQFEDLKP
jgi:hypothetical protein